MAVAEIMRLSLQPTEARLASRERPDHVKIGRVKGLEMEHIHRVLCQQLPVGAHRIFLDTADQHHPLLRLIHDEIEELRGAGEVLAKRLRTRIEVDEDKAAILIEQRHRLELVKRVSLEVRRIGFRSVQTDQLACVVELPCMVDARSEEHTSELQSLMRISYAVF